ncbi:hypothetical protein INT45_007444 [Circinella minor]|uniref:Uncharacterized protein n=1 Tax=Circinella minor TaxID=1195481 RepID=A0A8H7SDJ9_9FUNG|nr:hypothetical protein INT45_007444 [Circinella minor]
MKPTFILLCILGLFLYAQSVQAICNCTPLKACKAVCGNGSTCQNKASVCRSTGCNPGWDYMCWGSG